MATWGPAFLDSSLHIPAPSSRPPGPETRVREAQHDLISTSDSTKACPIPSCHLATVRPDVLPLPPSTDQGYRNPSRHVQGHPSQCHSYLQISHGPKLPQNDKVQAFWQVRCLLQRAVCSTKGLAAPSQITQCPLGDATAAGISSPLTFLNKHFHGRAGRMQGISCS